MLFFIRRENGRRKSVKKVAMENSRKKQKNKGERGFDNV